MFLGINPQRFCPAFNIKAVWFYGNSIGGTEYSSKIILTGIITAFLAQGYNPEYATVIGVYVHGLAGDMAAQ